MILAQAMKPIPQANQRGEQEQTTPVCYKPASIRYPLRKSLMVTLVAFILTF